MRRFLVILVLLFGLVSLFGCGIKPVVINPPDANVTQTATAKQRFFKASMLTLTSLNAAYEGLMISGGQEKAAGRLTPGDEISVKAAGARVHDALVLAKKGLEDYLLLSNPLLYDDANTAELVSGVATAVQDLRDVFKVVTGGGVQ